MESTDENVGLIPATGRVAVLGAGAAGLQSARQLVIAGYDTHVYEATDHVGGIWAYSASFTSSSPLYESLRSNIPNPAMTFENEVYPPDVPLFAPHRAVCDYLESYANRCNLLPRISFNTRVQRVWKTDGLWHVSTEHHTRTYDAVFVCTGHFSVPRKWHVEGIEHLASKNVVVQHSTQYKCPDQYTGKRVLVLGVGPSGIDISLEIATVASQVYLSHSRPSPVVPTDRPDNLKEIDRVEVVRPTGEIQFQNGEVVTVDYVMACTGYRHHYPFLVQGEAGIRVGKDAMSVHGLVRHCVAYKDPTMLFIGLPEKTLPFPMF